MTTDNKTPMTKAELENDISKLTDSFVSFMTAMKKGNVDAARAASALGQEVVERNPVAMLIWLGRKEAGQLNLPTNLN